MALSLPATGTQGEGGGGAFNGVPGAVVSVGVCPCLLFWCPEEAWRWLSGSAGFLAPILFLPLYLASLVTGLG